MKNLVPIASALALFALPVTAQIGGTKAPSAKGSQPAGMSQAFGSGCPVGDTSSLLIPIDESFAVVPFLYGGDAPCYRNDDDSSLEMPLEFNFEFYGDTHQGVYINNNGNISFGDSFGTYSSYGFPIDDYPMLAPFWGDVDTEEPGGVVYYRSEENRFVVTWENVGHYGAYGGNQSNTFQVILTDGSDPLIGLGNNVCFSYGDMQWTTGSASGGTGGFGGTPATVGANKGDGIAHFLVGRFDQPGEAYDGPSGANDGVEYLDNRVIAFNTGSENTAPIVVDSPDGCVSGLAGESVSVSYTVIGPEGDQTVDWFIGENSLPEGFDFDFEETLSPGVTSATFTWNTTQYDAGEYWCQIHFTDNGNPPLTTSVEACFQINGEPSDEILGEAGQFNVYSTRQLTITNAQVSGRIGARNNFFISNSQIAYGDVAADVDSMACGRAVHAANGVLQAGNIVAELHLNNLENTFHLANSTQAPRVDPEAWDHDAMVSSLYANSATYGAMTPTGAAQEDGFGNLTLMGSGANPEIFLITDNQLEDASRVIVRADEDANVLINVEGGRVSPSNFGFELEGVAANRVLLNMFEAYEVDFSHTDLKASVLAPDCVTYVTNIAVSGNIVGRWMELLNMDAQGDLLVGSIPTTTPFTFSQPMEELKDTLTHNLVVKALTPGDKVSLKYAPVSEGGALLVNFEGAKVRSYRPKKVAMVTFGGGIQATDVSFGGSFDLPVHYLEDGPLAGADIFSLTREGYDTTRRGFAALDVLGNDLAGSSGLDQRSLRIVTPPKNGIARVMPKDGTLWYAWAETKTGVPADSLEYVIYDNNGVASAPVLVNIRP